MSDQENLELVRRFNQIPGAADLSVLEELLAPDFVAHSGDGQELHGPDGWRQFIRSVQEQAGDMESGQDEVIVTGDFVGERWWVRSNAGTRRGITMHRIVNGKLAEDSVVFQDS